MESIIDGNFLIVSYKYNHCHTGRAVSYAMYLMMSPIDDVVYA